MTVAPSIARLSRRALIALSGEDWRSFLQGLITQDVETLAEGEIRFGALLTPQGRLLFDLFVIGRQNGCWLDVEAAGRAALISRLMMYRLRARVVIVPDETPVFAAWINPDNAMDWIMEGRSVSAALSALSPLFDPRLTELGVRGYAITTLGNASEADYDAHRLRFGVPSSEDWGSDKTYPIEANFDLLNGIDFQKGCFVGQETTSRMKRRGLIKTRMMPIQFDGDFLEAGVEVLAGELRAGEVLSVCPGRAMALMRLDRSGAALSVGGRPVTVEPPVWLGYQRP